MTYFIWAVIIFLTFILQASFSLFDVTPNLTVILAFYAGIRKGEVRGLLIGALIGIIEDSLSGAFLGPNLLSKGLVGYFSSLMYSRYFIWTPLLGIISIMAFTLIDSFLVFASRSIFERMPGTPGSAVFIFLIQAFMNALSGLLIKPAKKE